MPSGHGVDGTMVKKQMSKIRMAIKRKKKPNIVMYFDTVLDIQNFHDFIKELITNVKKECLNHD